MRSCVCACVRESHCVNGSIKETSAYNKWIRVCLITGAQRCVWDKEAKYIYCDILVLRLTSLHHGKAPAYFTNTPSLSSPLLYPSPYPSSPRALEIFHAWHQPPPLIPTPSPCPQLPALYSTSCCKNSPHPLPPPPPPSEAKVICHVKMQIRGRSAAPLSGTKAQRRVECCQCDAWSCTCKSLATHAIACQQRRGRIIHDYSIEGTSASSPVLGCRGTVRLVRENCCIPRNGKVMLPFYTHIAICSCFIFQHFLYVCLRSLLVRFISNTDQQLSRYLDQDFHTPFHCILHYLTYWKYWYSSIP